VKSNKRQNPALFLPLLLWVAYAIWWVLINYLDWPDRDNYTDSYSLIALTTSVAGIIAAKKWGLFKSKFGAAIGYFSAGLFLQFLGHFIYALYFRIGGVELAYPNIGDVPFLLTGVLYILAVYNLLKVIVYRGSIFKPRVILLVSVTMTLLLAWLVYVSFLHLGLNDERGALYSLLNFSYPFIQAFYFLLGIIALMQSKRMSGGKMLGAVSVMLIALIVQYAADFSFLYQSYHETWEAAGSNDLVYVMAYGLMSLSILMIDRVRRNAIGAGGTK
jgi:hypothetical protein